MKNRMRFLAILLAAVLCVQSMPVNMLAQEAIAVSPETSETISVSESSVPEEVFAESTLTPVAAGEDEAEKATSGDYTYTVLDGEYIMIDSYTGTDTEVVIPTLLDGYTVSSIGASAFKNNTTLQSVEIPDSVTSIGENAFYGCKALTSVSIGSGVTSIGASSFAYCSALSAISLPDGIKTIPNYAFRSCTSLSEVTLPSELLQMNQFAFAGCTSLEAIVLPDSITTMGKSVFNSCSSLTSVNYPVSLSSCGQSVFEGCLSLTSVSIPEGVTTIAANVFYNATSLTQVSIPSTVTTIGSYAFHKTSNLTSVTLPDGLTTIGEYAFYCCSQLGNVSFPDTLTTIGGYAFTDCISITEVVYPDALTTLGNSVFSGCTKLKSVQYPVGLTSSGTNVYGGCTSLTEMEVPSGITNLPANVFCGASYLKTVTLPDTIVSIGDNAFKLCSGLTGIDLPDNLESIGAYAFMSCTGLKEITLPNKVSSIGSSAFSGCTSLKSMNYPLNLSSTGSSILSNCSNLTSITVPEGVTAIPANAFYGANYLKTVYLPESLTSIGNQAFRNCSSLTRMILPEKVTALAANTFQSCTALEAIYIGENVTSIYSTAFTSCSTDTLVIYGKTGSAAETFATKNGYTFSTDALAYCDAVISGSVVDQSSAPISGVYVSIYNCDDHVLTAALYTDENGEFSFQEAEEGATYTISFTHALYDFEPESQTIVAESENALNQVVGTSVYGEAAEEDGDYFTTSVLNGSYIAITGYTGTATTLIIPDTIEEYTVQKISTSAFSSNKTLEHVVIPSTVTTIENNAFRYCTSLKSVRFAGPTTSIGNYAFGGCTSLSDVKLPEGLKTLNVSAFSGDIALESIHLPDSLTTMGGNVFSGCTALSDVSYPLSLTSCGSSIFSGCTSLTSVEIPEGVKSLSPNIFYGASSLTDVSLPSGLTTIGEYAFYNATGITGIELPETLVSINQNAFYGCTGLEKIELPEKVQTIGVSAFRGCSKLQTVAFPNSVKSLGSYSFAQCTGLETISYPVNLTTAGSDIFSGCSKLTKITVPYGVTTLPDNVFNGFTSLNEVDLPSSLLTIGASAFRSCSGLAQITLPENVTTLGASAFMSCSGLTEMTVPDKVTSIGNECFSSCTNLKQVVLPEGLKTLGKNAFKSCSSLTEINYPAQITSTNTTVFEGCTKLTKITVSEGMETLPTNAFYGASYLQSVYLPETLIKVGSQAFYACSSLKRIILPESVTTIGDSAFTNCTNMNAIYIGPNVTSIATTSFSGCSTETLVIYGKENSYAQEYAQTYGYEFLTEELGYCDAVISGSVIDEDQNGVADVYVTIYDCKNNAYVMQEYTDENGAFCYSEAEKGVTYKITFSNGKYNFSVESVTISAEDTNELEPVVAVLAFEDVEEADGELFTYTRLNATAVKLTDYSGDAQTLLIPETIDGYIVQTIADKAFINNTTLETVLIPQTVTTIGYSAFQGCTNLKEVRFAGSVTTISYNAWRGCTSLQTIRLPEGLTSIGTHMFDGCINLTEVILPDSLASIGDYAFAGCSSLSKINYPRSLTSSGTSIFTSCSSLTEMTIPEGVQTIPGNVFQNCTNLTDVSLPSTLTSIGASAFNGCTQLGSIDLPDGLKTIGASAFSGCKELTSVVLPDTVTTINNGAFQNCSNLSEINYPVNLTSTGYNIFLGCKNLKKIVVPDGIKTIPSSVFYGADYVEEVVLPEGLEYISSYAFWGCTSLLTINLPESLTLIKEYAFKGCSSLTEIVLPANITSIGKRAFDGCSSITKIGLPDSIKTIGDYAFSSCKALQDINYPLSLNSAGTGVFEGCESLYYLTIPEGVEQLPDQMFSGAKYFKEIKLPTTLTVIGSQTFYECDNLETMTIPDSVTSIGSQAFYGCDLLRTVIVKGESLTSIAESAFAECTVLNAMYLPASLTDFGNKLFLNCDYLCIYCPYNSAAMLYAIDNNIDYVASGANTLDEDSVLNSDGTNYALNLDSINMNGYAKLTLNYQIKEEAIASLTDMYLKLYFSQNYNINEDTLLLNDVACEDYTYENLILTVPVTESSGTLTFYAVPGTAPKISSYAKFAYTMEEVSAEELIGSVNEATAKLEFVTDSIVTTPVVTFSGTGLSEAKVLVYLNNELVSTVMTNKLGTYSGEFTIENPVEGKGYVIKAISGKLSSTQEIVYRTNVPQVESFKLYYNGNEQGYDLLGGDVPLLIFDPEQPYVFEIEVSNRELVDTVCVFSTKNNTKCSLEAVYNEEKECYVTSGYFDENDHGYIPGTLSVGINCVQDEVVVSENYDFAALDIFEAIAKAEVTEDADLSKYTMDLTLSLSENSTAGETYFDIDTDTLSNDADSYAEYSTLLTENGSVVSGSNDAEYVFAIDYDARLARTYVYRDNSAPNGDITIVTISLRAKNNVWSSLEEFVSDLADAADESVADEVDLYEIRKSSRDRKINASADISDKQAALQVSEELYKDQLNLTMLKTLVPHLASNITSADELSIIYTALAAVIVQKEDYFRAFGEMELTGWTAALRWTTSPTGYVYEGVTQNRLANVKTTIYYKESEDATPVVWDAASYGLSNPVYTDEQGVFLLDMPNGYWQAQFEAEGYETKTTDWYASIPQQSGLMIRMVPTANLSVSEFTVEETYVILSFSQYVSPEVVAGVQLFDADENEIAYTLECTSEGTDENGNVLAKEYKLIYTEETLEYGAKLSMNLPADLTSSDGKPIDNTSFTALCKVLASISVPANASLKTGTISKIPVTVYNYDETLNIVASSDDDIISVESAVEVDESGNGLVTVTAKEEGTAAVLVEIEGTAACGTIAVTVGDTSSVKDVQYVLTYSPGTASGEPQTQYMRAGDSIVLATCPYSNEGYNFVGWSDGLKTYAAGETYTMPDDHVVLLATWKEIVIQKPDENTQEDTLEEAEPEPQKIAVSSIKLTGVSKKIAAGKKITLTATVLPANADDCSVTWTSSNKKYATVNSKGVVSVKKAGAGKTVTITATANDGSGKKATYKIKIMKNMVKKITLKASSKTVKAGKSIKIKTTIKTTGKKVNKTLKWTSSNTKYATVNSKGVVKTKKAGKGKTVTITATSTDGTNKKARIKIKIK